MKKIKTYIMLSLLACTACQVEDDGQNELLEEDKTFSIEAINSSELKGGFISYIPGWSNHQFRRTLSGVGVVMARAISNDPQAESQYVNIMNQNGGKAELKDLIGPHVSPRHLFDAFKSQYEYMVLDHDLCPDSFDPQPYPSDPGFTGITFSEYLYNILDEHCLEIITPYTYDFAANKITSVTHPLNSGSDSVGYIYPPQLGTGCFGETSVLDYGNNISIGGIPTNHDNLMIIRPSLSDGPGEYCGYPMYSSIDWEKFFGD